MKKNNHIYTLYITDLWVNQWEPRDTHSAAASWYFSLKSITIKLNRGESCRSVHISFYQTGH